jgi:DNA polymerase
MLPSLNRPKNKMTTLRIDLETFSSVDLRKAGMHRYVESDDFQVMLLAYAFDAEPVQVIDLMQGEPIPPEVETAIFDSNVIKTAYNAAFELACLGRHFGRALDPMQWRCTSVHALYLGLPGNLADVGKVVGLPEDQQKKRSGSALIRYFCIPCKPTKANMNRTRNKPIHDREKWRLFKAYCAGDVVAEREIANRLAKFPVPDKEHRLWVLDQKMNNKGVTIDRTLVEAAIQCDQIYKQKLTNEAIALTGLSNPNSRNQLLAWLVVEDGTDVEDLTKKTVPAILKNTESDVVRRVMELRQQLAKTSVSKYHAMQRSACNDAAVRGLTQFYGANRTGRWAGRLVQVQNLPQNKHKDIDLARNLMKAGDFDGVDSLFGSVFDTLSQLIRTAFVARPGHKFVIVDFSAIEARVVAWLAWCQWRIDVFNTHGKIYEASAEQMFKLPPGSVDKKSPYRFKGKVAELALGYQGGAGALKTMGALDMGLTEDELEPIKVAWREANPEVVQFWYDCEGAAKEAVSRKASVDVTIAGGRSKLTFIWESGFLFIGLPSGRRLAYVKPRIEAEDLYREKADGSKFQIARAGSLTYEGLDQKTKQWTRVPTYGGKLVENITQAIARDLLAESMLALDDEGFSLLTTVHDEIVAEELIDGPRDVHLAEQIMGRPIPWAEGLPLRGDGFETPYYMKEID